MRIGIKSGKLRLYLWLPLSLLKSRLTSKILKDAVTGSSAKCNTGKQGKSGADGDCASDKSLTESGDAVCTMEVATETPIAETAGNGCLAAENELDDYAKIDEKKGIAFAAGFVPDREFLKNMYFALKQVIKKCGHFTLIDVADADGKEKIKIII